MHKIFAEKVFLGGFLLSAVVFISGLGCKSNPASEAPIVQQEVYNSGPLNYLLFMPKSATAQVGGKFPLIFSLHGIGERGNDLRLLKRDGLAKILDGNNSFPFIVISPQCPSTTEWYYDRTDTLLKKLLDHVLQRYPIDSHRVYLTGYSMGGIGSWDLAIRYPQLFAAVAPIAARGESYATICAMKEIPVWAFHGARDEVVDLFKAQAIVDALRNCGGSIQLTIYPDAGHDAWTRTYNNFEIYDWLLRQKRP
jgi:predicted peptidase